MGFSKLRKVGALSLVFFSLFLISCDNNEDKAELIEGINLNKGSITENKSGTYSNYNLQDGKYVKIEKNEVIGLYDYESKNYISQKDEGYVAFYKGKERELSTVKKEDMNLNLSPNGEYLSYFNEDKDGIYNPHILSLKTGKEVTFAPTVGFSWRDMDWLDEKTLVYYGVSNDRTNGIFIYDLETGKEELLHKLDGGVQFLKGIGDGVIFFQETLDNSKIIKEINRKTGEEKDITSKITELTDIIKNGDDYFVLGKEADSNYSIFKISGNEIIKMIYDFPEAIKIEKGLSIDEDGNILFIGMETDYNLVRVYSCSKDLGISRASKEASDYNFIKRSSK